jgi:DNA primase
MQQPASIGVRDYYRRITSGDISEVAREILKGRITQFSEHTLHCDCPQHSSQSKRSLVISRDKQLWHCFGCAVGGDVLQLVEFVHSGCVTRGQSGRMPDSHREARDFLAARMRMPPLSCAGLPPEAIQKIEQDRQESLRVFEALTAVADYYHRRLLANQDALRWFREKYGIGADVVDRLKIGFAENGPWTDAANEQQRCILDELCGDPHLFTHSELAATSAFRPWSNSITPFFDRRIVFPYWSRGYVRFMIGRRTPWTPDVDWERAKYKKLAVQNSEKHPHVSACIKNDLLFNEDVLSTRPARIVITEGVTDCISLMEHGFPAISPVTVRFKDADWERILPNLAGVRTVYLCQDNELSDVGLQGAIRTAQHLTENGIAARIALLPLGERQQAARKQLKDRFGIDGTAAIRVADPDRSKEDAQLITTLREESKIDVNEFFAKGGSDSGFEAVLRSAQTPVQLSISHLSTNTSDSPVDLLLEPILAAVKHFSPVEQELHLRLIQERLGKDRFTLAVLRKQLQTTAPASAVHNKVTIFPGPEYCSPPSSGETEFDWTESPPEEDADGLPGIQLDDRQLREVVADAWAAVHAANQPDAGVFPNSPFVFRRGPSLGYLALRGESHEIEEMSESAVYGVLARSADWHRDKNVLPMKEVARDMLAFVDPQLPQLDAVLRTPVLARDGSLIVAPGYHANDYVWMDVDPTLNLESLPSSPGDEEVRAARDLLFDELLPDFPFKDPSDRAHAIAALILPFVRRMIDGPTPNHLIEAPTPGSGKGLLANTIGMVATGETCESRTLPERDEEIRKMITSELKRARSIVLLDNANGHQPLYSSSLASVLTAVRWTDRDLGVSRMVSVRNQALWMMTGNNPRLDTELARRCVRVRIVPQTDRPWLRKKFKHPDQLKWVKEHRGQLVSAALTLVLGWIAAGRTVGTTILGSFESWSEIMGGILGHAGIEGFLANLEKLYEEADRGGQKWRDFVAAWWKQFKDAEVQVAALNEFCERRGLLPEVRGEGTTRSQEVRLGNALGDCRDRRFDSFEIVKVALESKHKGVSHYRLVDNELQ